MNIELRDGKMMFNECILLFDGAPKYIGELNRDVARTYDLTADAQRRLIDHKNYELFKAIDGRLGYVNLKGNALAFYVQRKPIRQFKVGLTNNNTEVFCPEPHTQNIPREKYPLWDGLEDCLKNNYPSLEECVSNVRAGYYSWAFDKQFAINRRLQVFYKSYLVGMVNDDGKTVNLTPKYEYLRTVMRTE